MIRRRDQIRLSAQKLALRKKRAVFSIISVALGVLVLVAINSLIHNIRDLLVKTNATEDIDPDVIQISGTGNPYAYGLAGPDQAAASKKRLQFLSESTFETMRGWPGVEAADHPVQVRNVTMESFAKEHRAADECMGVPEALLKRYAKDPKLLADATNAIPMVVGERVLRLRYDARKKNFALESPAAVEAWIGKELVLTLGDNYAGVDRFEYDGEKKQWKERPQEEIDQQRENIQRGLRDRYDGAIIDTTLALKGRIVGICPGRRVLIPLDTANSFEKWITQRRQLASLHPLPADAEVQYGVRGRQTPKRGEYNDGIVVVRKGVNMESVAGQIREMGLQATTRASVFEEFTKEIDAGVRFVKRIAYAFGGVIFAIACGLLWSTTSRIVSDSRADIGLLRALGATKQDIRRLFLSEAALLGLLGTLTGIVLGWTTAFYISRWVLHTVRGEISDPDQQVLLPDSVFSVDARFCLELLLFAAIVSILAGWVPANRAARIDPIKALKRE